VGFLSGAGIKERAKRSCVRYHKIHKDVYDWFNIEFDIFGRTPTPQQTEIVQDIFSKLWKNGYIEERETIQPFCPVKSHNTFLADRFVEGECSICHALDARGDQCDTVSVSSCLPTSALCCLY
jgi:methionyl-tRNA synthetase